MVGLRRSAGIVCTRVTVLRRRINDSHFAPDHWHVSMADEAHSSTPYISLSNLKPVNETTYLKAISEIRSRIKK
jgi:hypothetical protein